MNTNDAARNGVNASPWDMPMKKPMVGPMNCRKPMNDSGMRRAAQANSISGVAVNGPQASSQAVAETPAPKCPAPVFCSQTA